MVGWCNGCVSDDGGVYKNKGESVLVHIKRLKTIFFTTKMKGVQVYANFFRRFLVHGAQTALLSRSAFGRMMAKRVWTWC